MNTKDYEKFASGTVLENCKSLNYLTLGLVNEAGEFAGKVKKITRGDYTQDFVEDGLINELGDVLWYLTNIALYLGVDLETVMIVNKKKLTKRKEKGLIQGSGDDREE